MNVLLSQIARLIGAEIQKNTEDIEIQGVASLEDAGRNDVSFLSHPKYAKYLEKTHNADIYHTT